MFSANNPPSLPSVDSADRQPAVQHNCEHQVAQPFSFLMISYTDNLNIVSRSGLYTQNGQEALRKYLFSNHSTFKIAYNVS